MSGQLSAALAGQPGTGLACNDLQCGKKKNFHILTLKLSLHPVSQYINFNSDIGSAVNSSYVISRELLRLHVPGSRSLLMPSLEVGTSFICGDLKGRVFLDCGKKAEIWNFASGFCPTDDQSRPGLSLAPSPSLSDTDVTLHISWSV